MNNKYIKFIILLLSLGLISNEACAFLFDVAPTDRSVSYLGIIFGGKVGNIQLGGGFNATLSDMFARLNYIVLTLAVVVVSYIGVVSIINTSREGEALGKKWNSIWIPVRAVLGMMAMIPLPNSGYSCIQTLVMWIVLQGIGAANEVWSIVTDNVLAGRGGAAVSTPRPNVQASDLNSMSKNMMHLAVCKNFLNSRDPATIANTSTDPVLLRGPVDYFPLNLQQSAVRDSNPYFDPSFENGTSTATGEIIVGVPSATGNGYENLCGSISFTAVETVGRARSTLTIESPDDVKESETNQLATDGYIAKLSAIRVSLAQLDFLARQFVNDANSYLLALQNSSQAGFNTRQTFTSRLRNQGDVISDRPTYDFPAAYEGIVSDFYTGELSVLAAPQAITDRAKIQRLQEAKDEGWIHAGSYYMVMFEKPVVEYHRNVSEPPTITLNESSAGINLLSEETRAEMQHMLNVIDAQFTSQILSRTPGGNAFEQVVGGAFDTVGEAFTKLFDILQIFIDALNPGDGDPLEKIGKVGIDLMWTAEAAWLLVVIGTTIASAAAYVSSYISSAGFALTQFFNSFLVFFLSILAMLWGSGAFLGVYVPMIPFIIFMVASMGWMMAVIEAVVAAPILALGFVAPAQDELGKVTHGISILTNIFLRPMLMVFGWVMGVALLRAMIRFINATFQQALSDQVSSSTMFSWVIPIVLYVTIITTVTNKCFTLIHILPDKIMRWIGGQAETTDVGALQEIKQGADSGTKNTQDVQQGAQQAALANAQSDIRNKKWGNDPDIINNKNG